MRQTWAPRACADVQAAGHGGGPSIGHRRTAHLRAAPTPHIFCGVDGWGPSSAPCSCGRLGKNSASLLTQEGPPGVLQDCTAPTGDPLSFPSSLTPCCSWSPVGRVGTFPGSQTSHQPQPWRRDVQPSQSPQGRKAQDLVWLGAGARAGDAHSGARFGVGRSPLCDPRSAPSPLWASFYRGWNAASPVLTNCVILGKLLHLSLPRVPPLHSPAPKGGGMNE